MATGITQGLGLATFTHVSHLSNVQRLRELLGGPGWDRTGLSMPDLAISLPMKIQFSLQSSAQVLANLERRECFMRFLLTGLIASLKKSYGSDYAANRS